MNQYTVELIYEPIYFLIILIGLNLIFKIYKQSLLRQTIYYSIISIFFIISIILVRFQKSELEKEKVNFTGVSKILTIIVILTTIGFLYYMMN